MLLCRFSDGVTICQGSRESCEWVWSVTGGRVPVGGVCPLPLLSAVGQVSFHGDSTSQTSATHYTTGNDTEILVQQTNACTACAKSLWE